MAPWRRVRRLPREDLVLLVGMLALAVAVLSFVLIARAVDAGRTQDFDQMVVVALRDPANPAHIIGGNVVDETARDITALGSIPILAFVAIAVAGFLALSRLYRALVLVAGAAIGGTIWTFLLKDMFSRARPSVVPDFIAASTSFPSGHASLSAVIYLTFAALLARLVERHSLRAYVILVAAGMTFLIGCSRVALGVHYPSDVLAGWILGLAWAIFCWTGMGVLQRRGAVETAEEAAEVAHHDVEVEHQKAAQADVKAVEKAVEKIEKAVEKAEKKAVEIAAVARDVDRPAG